MTLDTDIARLSRVPLFSPLGTSALRLLAFAAETRSFKQGDVLFRQGETADGAFLIVAGEVEVFAGDATDATGRSAGPGALLGEQALLAEVARPVSARAAAPTVALTITRAMMTRVLREYPASATVIRQMWARRLHERLTSI